MSVGCTAGKSIILTYLHNATPSLRLSSRSPLGSLSPRTLSIQELTSFAAAGVYLSKRNLRKSLSNDVTEAILFRYIRSS